ncbi:MAG: acyltransferase family protein [Gemmatimonadaceae bacterium]
MSTNAPGAALAAPGGGITTTVAPAPARHDRLLSLDVFRGLTIAAMLLVNNPGSWGAIYPPLAHAAWHGWTPTDLIFPFFLFIVGVTTHLSLSSRRARGASDGAIIRQILKRGGVILLLGLLLAAFPFYWPPTWDLDRLLGLRIPGVLQRIAVVYVAAALITLRTTLKEQVAMLAALLLGYWFLMTLVPVPGRGIGALLLSDSSANLAAYVDRLLLGEHLWSESGTWDPEGILSTIPAIGTTLLGYFAGRWIATPRPLAERVAALFAVGSIGMVVGQMWGWVFPINKNLWTSSYVVFTAGMACTAIGTCMWLIDQHRITWWTKPFVIFGMNPILAFVGSGLLARLIYSVIRVQYHGETVSLQSAMYRSFFASWLEPRNASLAFAVLTVTLWLGALALLYRRGIFLKV